MSKERDSKQRIAFVRLLSEVSASENVPDEIHVVPTGKWQHPVYGEMEITSAHIGEFVQNFKDKVRLKIPITQGHDNGMSGGELPAIGWFDELIDRGVKGLYAVVSWTEEGKRLLREGAFKYFSPEFYEEYSDPETQDVRHHVLVGGAHTNKPYFKELSPVVAFSEPGIIEQFNDTMNLKTILAKKASELSAEEKTFLREHKEELNDEQKTSFKSVFDENGGEGAGGEGGEGGSGAGDGNGDGGAGEGEGGSNGGQVQASEGKTVQISAAELGALKQAADAGAKALQKIEASERKALIEKLTFSATNTEGRFLPKQSGALESFLKTLSESQRDAFRQIVSNMPKADVSMFKEIGDSGQEATGGVEDIAKQVQRLATEKMTANNKLTYSEAVKAVFTEKSELKADYEKAMEAAV